MHALPMAAFGQHDGAVQAQRRPGRRLPAVGQGPRRLRARRGRGRHRPRVRGARQGARRPGLRRGCRRRHHRRLPRHRPARPRRARGHPGHEDRACARPTWRRPTSCTSTPTRPRPRRATWPRPAPSGTPSATRSTASIVTSTKSMTGHLLGAAGALESVATVLALHNRVGAADDQPRRPRGRRPRHRRQARATCPTATWPR